jgi:hypothetical protein
MNKNLFSKANCWLDKIDAGQDAVLSESLNGEDKWFDENKNSDKLKKAFDKYVEATQKKGGLPKSYPEWATKIYRKNLNEELLNEGEEDKEKHKEPDTTGYSQLKNKELKKICDYIIEEIKQIGVAVDQKDDPGIDEDWYKEEVKEVINKLKEIDKIAGV